MIGHRVALLLAMAIAPWGVVRADGPWMPRPLAASGPVPQATLLPVPDAATPGTTPASWPAASVALASSLAPAPPAADGDSAPPAETVATPPADAGPDVVSAGPALVPAPPIERLPWFPPDPPVPYYSAYQGAELYPPPSSWLELPGVKLGWIFSAEADYVQPFVHNGLHSGPGAVGPLPEDVSVPQARAGWTTMPRIDAGYRFEDGLGEFHAIYRLLNNSTTRTIANFDSAGAGTVTSRLSMNVLDLDYGYLEFNLARIPRINPLLLIPGRLGLALHPEDEQPTPLSIKWFAGARIANVFFDSQGAGAQILNERVTNNFVGGGPRLGLDLNKPWPNRPWSIYARAEVSGLLGQTTQSFARTEILPGGATASGESTVKNVSLGVPVLDAACGVRYTPQFGRRLWRVTAGYLFEQWFYLGETSTSQAGVTLSGGFLRAEYGF